MSVHSLPFAAAPIAPPADRANPHVYVFGQVAFRLGLGDRAPKARIAHVRALIARAGFPAPLPAVNLRAGLTAEGVAAVSPSARWQRAAVDAWFDDRLPPGAAEAARSADRARDAAALDANADALVRQLGQRRRA